MVESTGISLEQFSKSLVLAVCNFWAIVLDVCVIFYFVVNIDEENSKDVLDIQEIRVSAHKGENPDDSEDYAAIGLSSEEEAEDLPDSEYIRRKFQAPPPPPAPPVPPTGEPSSSGTASIQVPVEMLQQVHQALGQLLQGQPISAGSIGSVPESQPPRSGGQTEHHEDVPFEVPVIKRGQKTCTLCARKFYSTEAYRRHMKTHTGEQKNICPNPGCGRKLSSGRSLTKHLKTCGKERNVFCPRKGCKAMFVDKAGLAKHSITHQTLKKSERKCEGCGQGEFLREKSKREHWRVCSANPNRVGPFPCPVAGCKRGPSDPFTRPRNLNQYLKNAHGHNPKHVK